MTKARALRLRPGEQITFGNHKMTARCTQFYQGEVLHVTPNGGIKVRLTRYGNETRWIPYTFAIG
jgi:hypothetical protein